MLFIQVLFVSVLFLYIFVCFLFVPLALPLPRHPHATVQALEEEIINHSKDLFQAVSLGQTLRSVSSVDDKEFVQSKLDAVQAGYIELQERCRRKAEMLQQALANAQLFGEDEVALMNWLNEVYARLNEVSVEDHKIDVLEKQLTEQRVHTLLLRPRIYVSLHFCPLFICRHYISVILSSLCRLKVENLSPCCASLKGSVLLLGPAE